jgi:hypothetical protein
MIAQLDKAYLKIAKHRVCTRLLSYLFYEGRPLTTKGRWINWLIFLNFQIFSRIPAPRKVIKPIFILGVGRSGSTILGKILSIHRNVGFLNEPKAFWSFLNPEDDIVGSYNQLGTGRYVFSEEDATELVIKKAHNIHGWYLFFSGSRRVLDKYPEHIFRVPYLKTIFPDAKFILLVRDVRDNSESIANWSKEKTTKINGEVHDWWGKNDVKWYCLINQVARKEKIFRQKKIDFKKIDDHKIRGEIEWFLTMREVLKLEEKNDTYLVRYEDLVNDRDNLLDGLVEFCELNYDATLKKYAKSVIRNNKEKKIILSSVIKELLEQTRDELGYG